MRKVGTWKGQIMMSWFNAQSLSFLDFFDMKILIKISLMVSDNKYVEEEITVAIYKGLFGDDRCNVIFII